MLADKEQSPTFPLCDGLITHKGRFRHILTQNLRVTRFPSASFLNLFLLNLDTDLSVVDRVYTFIIEEKSICEAGLCYTPRHTYMNSFKILRFTEVHGLHRYSLTTRRFSLYSTHLIRNTLHRPSYRPSLPLPTNSRSKWPQPTSPPGNLSRSTPPLLNPPSSPSLLPPSHPSHL